MIMHFELRKRIIFTCLALMKENIACMTNKLSWTKEKERECEKNKMHKR